MKENFDATDDWCERPRLDKLVNDFGGERQNISNSDECRSEEDGQTHQFSAWNDTYIFKPSVFVQNVALLMEMADFQTQMKLSAFYRK